MKHASIIAFLLLASWGCDGYLVGGGSGELPESPDAHDSSDLGDATLAADSAGDAAGEDAVGEGSQLDAGGYSPGDKPSQPSPADMAVPADQENDGCVALTAEEYENNEGNNAEFTAKFYPTKNRNGEYIDMFFRSNATGTHAYGVGDNTDLYTCKQCMLVVREGKNLFPTQGTISIASGSKPMGKTLIATLSKLKLIEIKISSSYHSIPVPGGECVTLAPASINVP